MTTLPPIAPAKPFLAAVPTALSGIGGANFARAAKVREIALEASRVGALLALTGLALGGCASKRGASTAGANPSSSISVAARTGEPGRYVNRMDDSGSVTAWARAGERLVLPVSPTPEELGAGQVLARLDRGTRLAAPIYTVEATPAAPEAGAGAWMRDFAPDTAPTNWRAVPVMGRSGLSPTGSYVALIDMPPEAVGQGLWIGPERVAMAWLPSSAVQAPGSDDEPTNPSFSDVSQTLASALGSPLQRWRARLALEAAGVADARSHGAFGDTVIEALASQTEAEWRAALAALRLADAPLEAAVRARLAGLVEISRGGEGGAGRVTVLWNPDQSSLEPLKRSLLGFGSQDRAEAARDWLMSEPSLGAWVIDDAGGIDARTGRVLGTVGVFRLPGGENTVRPLAAFARLSGVDLAPTLLTLEPGEVGSLTVQGRSLGSVDRSSKRRNAASAHPSIAEIQFGPWGASRAIAASVVPATPPGLVAGPLVPTWTLGAWWRHAIAKQDEPMPLVEPSRAAVAMLLAGPPSTRGPGGREWLVYVECRDDGFGGSGNDTVRLHFGARYGPLAVVEVSRTGDVSQQGASGPAQAVIRRWRGDAGDGPLRTPVRTSEGQAVDADTEAPGGVATGWCAWVSVPQEAFERTDPANPTSALTTLRLGIERIDPDGGRSAWPRAMTPWQLEPGRARIDVGAWSGLQSAAE